jgi:hypothetical protein
MVNATLSRPRKLVTAMRLFLQYYGIYWQVCRTIVTGTLAKA